MGGGVKEKEDEGDASLSSCSDSNNESDEEIRTENIDMKDPTHINQPPFIKKVRPCLLLRPPRCLRRNSSLLLPADSPFLSRETGYGIYGRYNRRRSSQSHYTLDKPIQTSKTSPSLCHLTPTGARSNPGFIQKQIFEVDPAEAQAAASTSGSCNGPLPLQVAIIG
ncbi:hypothetical protein D4764_03G0012780 [Takifugu flavidus]|uniref:Uncharacterized protein n=1 Tax=Takifugu flavidus TaxID=433684 RepID=A0A5C6NE78_9TELE|nr:hypothetical protein D4764_03G0012780 [Takifugu flavidus]